MLFTALHGMQTRSSDENYVCPSVCLLNAWFVTKRKKVVPAFLYHMKDHILSFVRRRRVDGGRPLLPEILGQPAADCSIAFKFGTEFHHVKGDTPQMFKVKSQMSRS